MDGPIVGDAGGFHDGFAERRMRVHGFDDLGLGGFEFLGQDELGEQFGDVFADHVDAEEFAVIWRRR